MTEQPQQRADRLAAEIDATERKIDSTDTEIGDIARRIEAGATDVGPEVIPDRRRLRDHLQHVVTGLRGRREQAAADARLVRLRALRAEIDAHIADGDEAFGELVNAATQAQSNIIKALNDRATRITNWHRQLQTEDIPPYRGGEPESSPAHAGLHYGDGLGAGVHRLRPVSPDGVLDLIRRNAEALARNPHAEVRPISLVRTAAPLSDGARYFVHSTDGTISYYDGDRVPAEFGSPHSKQREITREEAVRIWHGAGTAGQLVTGPQASAARRAVAQS